MKASFLFYLFTLILLCVCVYFVFYGFLCTCVHKYVKPRGWLLVYFLTVLHIFEVRDSYLTWSLLIQLDWLDSEPQGCTMSSLPQCSVYKHILLHPTFFCRFWGSSFRKLHACSASPLSTGPHSPSTVDFIMEDIFSQRDVIPGISP